MSASVITTFKDKLRREATHEDGVAMAAVLIIMMIMVMMSVLIVATVLAQANQTKTFGMAQNSKGTADFGLSAFLTSVNTSTGYRMFEQHRTTSSPSAELQKQTPPNALCKVLDENVTDSVGYKTKYCLWTVKVSTSTGTSGYYVYSKGFSVPFADTSPLGNPDDEVVLRMLVEPRVVSDRVDTVDGRYIYKLDSDSPFQLGVSGAEKVEVINGAKIYSHPFSAGGSSPSSTDTIYTALASDESFKLPYEPFTVNTLTAPSNKRIADICSPSGDNCNKPNQNISAVSASMDDVGKKVDIECPLPANQYRNWTASVEGGTIQPGCYNNVNFDTDMSVGMNYTQTAPLEIFVKGSVTFAAQKDIASTRDPAAFQIRSKGAVVWSESPVTSSTPARVNAYIASSSSCSSQSLTKAPVNINGALSCGSLVLGPKTTMYMDTKSQQYGIDFVNGIPVGSIWFQTAVEQL